MEQKKCKKSRKTLFVLEKVLSLHTVSERNPELMMHELIISHFTEDAWKTSFGIVRFKSKGKPEMVSTHEDSYAHALGVEHSYMWVGVPSFQARPLGKVHRDGHAITFVLYSSCVIYVLLIYNVYNR